jgi:hypothetical protein
MYLTAVVWCVCVGKGGGGISFVYRHTESWRPAGILKPLQYVAALNFIVDR